MKVIIVEVTRAANTFGRTHLAKIRDAYARHRRDRRPQAQAAGLFRAEITPEFAAQAFYGSVEQVLTGWIFDSAAVGDEELERAKSMIVDTICRGLERAARRASLLECLHDDGEPFGQAPAVVGHARRVRRARNLASTRVAAMIWMRVFGEEPPE